MAFKSSVVQYCMIINISGKYKYATNTCLQTSNLPYNLSFQSSLNSATSELQTVKDSQTHQKKRINEMLVSLLKDLNEVGTIIGTSNDAMKVDFYVEVFEGCSRISLSFISTLPIFFIYKTNVLYVFSLLWSEILELKLSLS